jgi:hypothetical protein
LLRFCISEKKNEALTREKEELERRLETEIRRNASCSGKEGFQKMVSAMLEVYRLKDAKAAELDRKEDMESQLAEIARRFFHRLGMGYMMLFQ